MFIEFNRSIITCTTYIFVLKIFFFFFCWEYAVEFLMAKWILNGPSGYSLNGVSSCIYNGVYFQWHILDFLEQFWFQVIFYFLSKVFLLVWSRFFFFFSENSKYIACCAWRHFTCHLSPVLGFLLHYQLISTLSIQGSSVWHKTLLTLTNEIPFPKSNGNYPNNSGKIAF